MYTEEELLKKIRMINWDTPIPDTTLLQMLRGESGGQFEFFRNNLYIKIVNGFSWHEVRKMLPAHRLREVLNEEVIRGLFPRNLRDKYRYVRSLL